MLFASPFYDDRVFLLFPDCSARRQFILLCSPSHAWRGGFAGPIPLSRFSLAFCPGTLFLLTSVDGASSFNRGRSPCCSLAIFHFLCQPLFVFHPVFIKKSRNAYSFFAVPLTCLFLSDYCSARMYSLKYSSPPFFRPVDSLRNVP